MSVVNTPHLKQAFGLAEEKPWEQDDDDKHT